MGQEAIPYALRLAGEPYSAPHVGPIRSIVAGRTDHVPLDVPAESFVIPADIVSGVGQGNTENGFRVFSKMLGLPESAVPASLQRAAGGKVGGAVPIMAAGGEIVVPPEVVARVGDGNTKRGHQILDHMVRALRKEHIKTLKTLKPPHK
jgi:hypothetical protein